MSARLSRRQRLHANLLYLRRPLLRFAPSFAVMTAALLLGGVCFHLLYQGQQLGLLQALYITYALVFMEHLLPFPDHWLLQLFYVALPPLGLVVILDGMVQFGSHLLRRDPLGREWNHAMTQTLQDHVILCGLGKAGIRVLQTLLRLDVQVCVLEKDRGCPNLAFAKRHGVPVLVGSGREEGILDELGVARARSIVLATNDDLFNLEMALDARKAKPGIHIVLRVFDQELAAKIRSTMEIPLAFSTKAHAAPLFATAACDPSIVNAIEVDDRLLVVARLAVAPGSVADGASVAQLSQGLRPLIVLSRARGGEVERDPDGGALLRAGDVVLVQTEPELLPGVRARLDGAPASG